MTSSVKNYLQKQVWTKKTDYYQKAKEASKDVLTHKGFKIINKYLDSCESILDVGCGEGTKLFKLGNKSAKKVGVDISRDAIQIAKKQYPQIFFKKVDIEKLPFEDNSYEAVMNAFVLEHTTNPQTVLSEMIRVSSKLIIIICPNFGAPNRHSPCFKGSKIVKLFYGLCQQLLPFNLSLETWKRVEPLSKGQRHISDWDTVIEPELLTLINFMKENNLNIKYWSGLWEEEVSFSNKIQKIFLFLSNLGIYPFINWGPQILVVAQKND